MKKLMILTIGLLLISVSLVTAMPSSIIENLHEPITTMTGSFEGSIGPRIHGNRTIGNISGSYELRNRGGRFNGEWVVSIQNTSKSGTVRGIFWRIFILGKITIDEGNRTIPIVGFIKFRNGTFVGRFMAPRGPALYFWGTYT